MRRMMHSLPISLRFELNGALTTASVVLTGQRRFEVAIGEQPAVGVELDELAEHQARFVCDGLFESAAFLRDGASLLLHYRGVPLRIEDKTRAASARQGDAASDGKLRASMNGRVVAVMAAVGDLVEAGQPILTLEAMKMEHVHAAPVAGRVAALHVKIGDQVAASRVVVEIEATATEPAAAG
jgi:geranyl-CoA carboxylase alpha subunit